VIEPRDALSIAAQVAVTLAGFAGIVVVFRPASVHQWSALDRFRLRLLLNNSIFPLIYSIIGLLLLAINPPPASIWRWCSAVSVAFQIPFAIGNFTESRRLGPAEFKGVSKILFFPLFATGVATIVLQFYNIAVLNWFWPFFVAIVVHILAATLQFMRLVLLPSDHSTRTDT
jgi:hypothetical protein